MSDLAAVLASLHRAVETLSAEEAPGLIGALESVKAKAWAKLSSAPVNGHGPGAPARGRARSWGAPG